MLTRRAAIRLARRPSPPAPGRRCAYKEGRAWQVLVVTQFGSSLAGVGRAMRLPLLWVPMLFCALSTVASRSACAEGPVPPQMVLPVMLTLQDAMRVFRARGLDLLIAEAAVRSAEGAVRIAGAVPNPVASGSVGNAFTFSN